MSFWHTASEELAAEHADENKLWANSPYAWIRTLSSSRKGRVGEKFVEKLAHENGIPVSKHRAAGSDRTIGKIAAEVKFSTLWATGDYCFQQIRDQEYSHAVLFGLSPHAEHLWVVPKAVLWAHSTPQHTGKAGTETHWLKFNPSQPPDWLAPYGGVDQAGINYFLKVFGGP